MSGGSLLPQKPNFDRMPCGPVGRKGSGDGVLPLLFDTGCLRVIQGIAASSA